MDNHTTPQKRCTKCGNEYPATNEYFPYNGKGLLRPNCKPCERDRTAQLRKDNPEKYRQKDREYGERNREKRRLAEQKRRRENPEYGREYSREYGKKHPQSVRRNSLKYRTRKRGLPFAFTVAEKRRMFEYWGDCCAVCGRRADFWTVIAVDHWIAVNDMRPDNPGSVPINMLPLCHARKDTPQGEPCCNNSKHDRDPIEWLIDRFGVQKSKAILKRINAYFEWVQVNR